MTEFVSATGLSIQAGAESISVADVVAVAEAAGAAILDIYNSETEVGRWTERWIGCQSGQVQLGWVLRALSALPAGGVSIYCLSPPPLWIPRIGM